jgi:hypothetical protein
MWLPMNMDTSRNQTYDKVLQGKYQNIRMFSAPHNNQPDIPVLGASRVVRLLLHASPST